MKALFLLPTVMAMQVTEDHGATAMNLKGDIEGMKELFLSVSKSQIDSATRQAVSTMLEQITQVVEAGVAEDMFNHNTTLDCKYEAIEACADARSKWDDRVVAAKNTSDSGKGTHRGCRVAEQTQCDDRNDLKTQCDGEVADMSKCDRHREHFTANSGIVFKWMRCLNEQVNDAKQLIATHNSYETKCKQQCATRETCNGNQKTFETDMCKWMTIVDEMCYEYDLCYDGELHRYNYHIENAKTAWEVATTQMTALTVLKCYGQSILDNRTSLDHCNDIPCVNCPVSPCAEHCPPPPAAVPCDERTRPCEGGTREMLPRPCESTFLNEEYVAQSMGDDTCTPAVECQTCHDFHIRPMYFAGRGQCYCDVGGTKDPVVSTPPPMDSAVACTEWCVKDRSCNYASWNADTHECIGLRNMNSQTGERPTAWSCYSKFSSDKVDVPDGEEVVVK